jgi:hypothetical protein
MTRMFGFFTDDGGGDCAFIVLTIDKITTNSVTGIRIDFRFIGLAL